MELLAHPVQPLVLHVEEVYVKGNALQIAQLVIMVHAQSVSLVST